jgi:hypothetical protein
MATLFIKVTEVIAGTPISGNVDVDRVLPSIIDAQNTVILPLIGQALHDELMLQIDTASVTPINQTLIDNYIKPIMRHLAAADFIENSSYMVANGGVFKHQPANAVVVDKSEVQYLAQIQRSKAQVHIVRCEDFLCKNNLGYNYSYGVTEEGAGYYCSDLKIRNVQVTGGWHI